MLRLDWKVSRGQDEKSSRNVAQATKAVWLALDPIEVNILGGDSARVDLALTV